jgi:DNA-binding MarR family transcriptional regulator
MHACAHQLVVCGTQSLRHRKGSAMTEHDLAVADRVGTAMIRLVRLIERKHAQQQSEHPDAVERATYHLLVHLVKDGPRRAVALAEAVHSDPSTVSRQVAHLVQLGLVERVADPADGRATFLVATDEGRRVFDENRQLRNRSLAAMMCDWPADDREAFARLLARFTDGFECHKARTGPPRS